jgi:hypothetical protein
MTATMTRDTLMFGAPWEDIKESIEDSITFKCCGPAMVAMSYMSDAQEMIGGFTVSTMHIEKSRQMINVAKRILADYVMEKRV